MTADHSFLVRFQVHDAGGWCRDVPLIVSAIRAQAAAWEQLPASGAVDQIIQAAHVRDLRGLADDLEGAHSAAVEEVHASWKRERREANRAAREGT